MEPLGGERRRLTDPEARKLAYWLRAAGGALILSTLLDAVLAASFRGRVPPVLSGIATVIFFVLILMAAARALTFRAGYRCPECGTQTERITDGKAGRRYGCARCNVEWSD